jgi:hypothetical protein
MPFERTATRVWRRLTPEERLAAATRFWEQPGQEVVASALAAIVKARRLRPQVARSLPDDTKARTLAALVDPGGEPVAAALLVALHLGERRGMLVAFLDALGLPHEEGLLRDEAAGAVDAEAARGGVQVLLERFPADQVRTYLNTLWLQDPERWASLEAVASS